MTLKEKGDEILKRCEQIGPETVAAALVGAVAESKGEEYAKGFAGDLVSIGVVAYALMLSQDPQAEKLFGKMFRFSEEDLANDVN